ncbi:unnamed protein product [Ranitomeya imitator]|uniref:NADH dehydrogenase subunit 6 n=1 Tax=Ranitomeya imitator TaxID=111125 RepID=A0ABN9L9V2_9NEOB|nr:unnamed protein product [Ranitomeya imitator]
MTLLLSCGAMEQLFRSLSCLLLLSGPRVFCVVVWIPFTIGMVVIGTLYMNRCATDPKIPIYLMVAGSVFLFGVALLLIHKACQKLIFVLEVFLCIFSVCWFALGSIWVFTIYNDASKDCHYILFNFAFGALLFQYILLAFILSFFCVCSSCLSFMVSVCTTRNPRYIGILLDIVHVAELHLQ